MTVAIMGGAILAVACYIAWVAATTPHHADSRTADSSFNVEDMRRRMLESAVDDEELAYLQELDQLELQLKHLIC